jgi:hypothetical protein
MTDDLTSLASAYLDGEATAGEIASVEGDAEALAEVERLRQVRAVVGDVDPPVISAREAHLAAALGAWDRLPASERNGSQIGAAAAGVDPLAAAAATSISAPPSRERRGSMSTGWILAAAASLVLLLAGGLTLRSLTDDDDGSDAVTEADAQPTAEDAATIDPNAATTDPSLEPSEDISDTDTEADASADGAPPPEEGLEELSDADQLAIYGSDALDDDGNVIESTGDAPPTEDAAPRESASTVAPADTESTESTDFPLCAGADFVVGPAVYQGTVVVVAIDIDNDLVLAYLPSNCAVIAQAPLP